MEAGLYESVERVQRGCVERIVVCKIIRVLSTRVANSRHVSGMGMLHPNFSGVGIKASGTTVDDRVMTPAIVR